MRKIANKCLLLLILIIPLTLIGCASNEKTSNNTKEAVAEEKKVEDHKIGDQVKLPLAKVSVTNVRKLDTKDTVYAVEIEVENTSKEDLESDFLNNYILKTVENRKGEAINNQDLKGELLVDTIKPGEKLKGEIAYELQENDSPKTFQISYDDKDYTVFDIENKK